VAIALSGPFTVMRERTPSIFCGSTCIYPKLRTGLSAGALQSTQSKSQLPTAVVTNQDSDLVNKHAAVHHFLKPSSRQFQQTGGSVNTILGGCSGMPRELQG
jgi:hypothetical protein